MKLEHFHYLLEVNRLRSISSAARSLRIRQTTLSAIVKAAEDELGFRIFQRTPIGVIATHRGEQFMTLAWEINLKREELLCLRQRTMDEVQSISLLLSPAVMSVLPLQLTQRYQKFEVQGNLVFHECAGKEIGPRLRKNASNIGVTYLMKREFFQFQADAEKNHIMIEPLLEDQTYLLTAKGHPFEQMDVVTVDMIREQRFAISKAIHGDAILVREKFSCPRFTVFSDINVMLRAVIEQGMVAFLPKYTILAANPDSELSYSVRPTYGTEKDNRLYLCLLYRQESTLRYQEKIILSCIREHISEFLGLHPEFAIQKEERTV